MFVYVVDVVLPTNKFWKISSTSECYLENEIFDWKIVWQTAVSIKRKKADRYLLTTSQLKCVTFSWFAFCNERPTNWLYKQHDSPTISYVTRIFITFQTRTCTEVYKTGSLYADCVIRSLNYFRFRFNIILRNAILINLVWCSRNRCVCCLFE